VRTLTSFASRGLLSTQTLDNLRRVLGRLMVGQWLAGQPASSRPLVRRTWQDLHTPSREYARGSQTLYLGFFAGEMNSEVAAQ
jgi:hypothetical protein